MSVNWDTGQYAGPRHLSTDIYLKGGLARFIAEHVDVQNLPKELRPLARHLQAAHDTCQCVFADAGVKL